MTALFVIAFTLTAIVAFILIARAIHQKRDGALQRKRADFIRNYRFPIALPRKVRERYPSLSDDQIGEVLDALREWFLLLLASRNAHLGMPSKTVDAAWHEFILMTRQYQAFCREAFGKFLHHAPNEGTPQESQLALARTLGAGSALGIGAGVLVGSVAAQQLFDIDQKLGIDNGNTYSADDLERLRVAQEDEARKASSGGCGGGFGVSSSGGDKGNDSSDGGSGDGGGCGGGCGS